MHNTCEKPFQFDIHDQIVRKMGVGAASPIFTDEKDDVHYIEPDLVQVTKKMSGRQKA